VRKARLLAGIGSLVIRLINATLRVKIVDRAGVLTIPPAPGQIWIFWHNRLFLIPHLREHYFATRTVCALTSASRDGELLAEFVRRFRIGAVRGSSSRRGAAALLQMKSLVESGCDIALTPDGPRGPKYRLNPGAVSLAQKTGRTVIPIGVEFSRCWRMGRWDDFMVPKPFARATVTFGEPQMIRATATEAEFEQERLRLQESLAALTITA
jgi:lysophospholipid acyltransferase (LPLAT)-like uncharacterized protein